MASIPGCTIVSRNTFKLNSSILKNDTVAGRLEEIHVSKKTNKTNKSNAVKTIKRTPQNKNSSIVTSIVH